MAHNLYSPMAGTVVELCTENECYVNIGDPLVIIEIMKMQFTVESTGEGLVFYMVDSSQQVQEGDLIAIIGKEQ